MRRQLEQLIEMRRLLLQLLLGPLAILDIHRLSIPLDQVALVVELRHAPKQEPAIHPVVPPQACFRLAGPAGRQERAPIIQQCGQVCRADCRLPAAADRLPEREARVLQPALVEEIDAAVGQGGPDQSWNGIDRETILVVQSGDVRGVFRDGVTGGGRNEVAHGISIPCPPWSRATARDPHHGAAGSVMMRGPGRGSHYTFV